MSRFSSLLCSLLFCMITYAHEQVAVVDLALLNLDEPAERFGLGQGWHLFRQYLRNDAVGISLEYHLVRLSCALGQFSVSSSSRADLPEKGTKDSRQVGSLKIL